MVYETARVPVLPVVPENVVTIPPGSLIWTLTAAPESGLVPLFTVVVILAVTEPLPRVGRT